MPRRMTTLGAFVLALLFAACASDPEQLRAERTVAAEYDAATGRLELIAFDSDDNGTADTWSYMDGRFVERIEFDRDEDGQIDRRGLYEAGVLQSSEEDADSDGRHDRWVTFEDGQIAFATFDEDGDGAPDRRVIYTDGEVASIEDISD